MTDEILKGFDEGLLTGMILIDLQKAFDTINHEILFKKLKAMGFSEGCITWFQSYLSERIFFISIENQLSDYGRISCGVPQGSILGPLLFLIYVNDMPQAVNSNLFLYADDSCLMFQHKEVEEIERVLNNDFENICDWFVDNKLSIHFGEDKTKSILFASQHKIKTIKKLNIKYQDIEIKQHSQVTYLGCVMDETMSGEPMALKVINKINGKLKFLYRKNSFLTPGLRRMLCNALIQPHFDYACSTWYPNLNAKLKRKLQIMQNKCIRFCLKLDKMHHISEEDFKTINWLPVNQRVQQSLNVTVFKYVNKVCPYYMKKVFEYASQGRISSRNNYAKLKVPFHKTTMGQKSPSYIGPSVWNKLPSSIKRNISLNKFKYDVKKHCLRELRI